jgi:hypothetical protein
LAEAGILRAYIVADNDKPGFGAIPAIARELRLPTFSVEFNDEFPPSFDLADPFPKSMWENGGGVSYYVGPRFKELVHPATWATDQWQPPDGKGKVVHLLRDSFKSMWAYVEEADIFVCREMPNIVRPFGVLNNMLAPFSHVAETARLIVKAYDGRKTKLCYRPDLRGTVVTYGKTSAINLHIPTDVKAEAGDPTPWLEFLKYLFMSERERKEVERWCATLIARPELRMGYGLLLISESQGVGKTTLASHILAPLVGIQNTGWPGEMDILGGYTHWVAHKRLVVISEIYAGASWKVYNLLKSVITDTNLVVNEKYRTQYNIENWAHLLACSNSMRALKIESDDRRWFCPEMTETPWVGEKFKALRHWLTTGGIAIVKHWAEGYGDYVMPHERAPLTKAKQEMIEGSLSEAQREAQAVAGALHALEQPGALVMSDVVLWVRAQAQGKVFDSDYELRRAMTKGNGVKQWRERMKIGPRLEYALCNGPLLHALGQLDVGEDEQVKQAQRTLLKQSIVRCNDIMQARI